MQDSERRAREFAEYFYAEYTEQLTLACNLRGIVAMEREYKDACVAASKALNQYSKAMDIATAIRRESTLPGRLSTLWRAVYSYCRNRCRA